jgi:dolichol-phosphate mannosyltransferase
MMAENFTVIIPVYNEEKSLPRLLPLLKTHKVIIVDDSPSNRSEAIASEYKNVTLIRRKSRSGLVSAHIEGFRHCKTDYAVTMDADLSHDPKYIKRLIKFASATSSDLVLGSRYVSGGNTRDSSKRKLMSKTANLLFRLAFYSNIKDATSGFRVYSKKAYLFLTKQKNLEEGWAGEVDIVRRLIDNSFKCSEFPIDFIPRKEGKSKLRIRDLTHFLVFMLAIGNLLKYIIVGLSGILVNEGFLFLLHAYNIYAAEFIAVEVSLITNFIFNETWTFKRRKLDKRLHGILSRLVKANAMFAIGFIVNYVSFFALYFVGVYYLLANLIAIALAFVFNYASASLFVWGEKKSADFGKT